MLDAENSFLCARPSQSRLVLDLVQITGLETSSEIEKYFKVFSPMISLH